MLIRPDPAWRLEFSQALSRLPKRLRAELDCGRIIAAMQEVVKNDLDSGVSRRLLARLLADAGRQLEAISLYLEAVTIQPEAAWCCELAVLLNDLPESCRNDLPSDEIIPVLRRIGKEHPEIEPLHDALDALMAKSYRRLTVELLVDIETTFDVNEIKFRGLHIWPMMRARLGRMVEEAVLNPRRAITRSLASNAEFRTALAEHVGKNVGAVKPGIHFLGDPGYTPEELSQRCDFLFYSRNVRNYIVTKGSFQSQEDTAMRLLQPHGSCLKIESYEKDVHNRLPRWEETVHFRMPWDNSYAEYKNRYYSPHLDQAEPWEDEAKAEKLAKEILERHDLSAKSFSFSDFKSGLFYMEAYVSYFSDLLAQLKPRAIFVNLYTEVTTLALSGAAARHGIPVIDIVNGGMGRNHWLYTHWTRLPDAGYECVPDFTWVWDEQMKANIETHFLEGHRHHRVIIGGQPRIEYWLGGGREPLKVSDRGFLAELKRNPFVILVTHQYVNMLPDLFLDALRKTPKEWTWLLRLHPQSKPLESVYSDIVDLYGFSNVIVDAATRAPLFELMECADHLITGFSTTALEAGNFNLDITLTGNLGRELFVDYLEAGLMKHAANADELIALLHKSAERAGNRQSGLRRIGPRGISPHLDEIARHWEAIGSEVRATSARLSRISFNVRPHDIVPRSEPRKAPTTKATTPTTKETTPTTKATAPTTKATAPTTKATAPTTKATAPTTKASTPVMQRIEKVADAILPHWILTALTPLARQLRLLEERIWTASANRK